MCQWSRAICCFCFLLCVCDREGKESIRFFDSLGGRHKPLAWRLRKYLQDEHKDKKGTADLLLSKLLLPLLLLLLLQLALLLLP